MYISTWNPWSPSQPATLVPASKFGNPTYTFVGLWLWYHIGLYEYGYVMSQNLAPPKKVFLLHGSRSHSSVSSPALKGKGQRLDFQRHLFITILPTANSFGNAWDMFFCYLLLSLTHIWMLTNEDCFGAVVIKSRDIFSEEFDYSLR